MDSTVDTAIIGELASSSFGLVFLQDIFELVSRNMIENIAEAIVDETTLVTAPTRLQPSTLPGGLRILPITVLHRN